MDKINQNMENLTSKLKYVKKNQLEIGKKMTQT